MYNKFNAKDLQLVLKKIQFARCFFNTEKKRETGGTEEKPTICCHFKQHEKCLNSVLNTIFV